MTRSDFPMSWYAICVWPPKFFSYATTWRLMSLYTGLRPPRPTLRGRLESFARYTPPLAPNTRSFRRPVEYDGSAGFAGPPTAFARPPCFVTSILPPVTKAIDLQSPETATAVVGAPDCFPPGSETRRGLLLPEIFATKASTWPLVSPEAMFEAADRKPTHVGALWKAPSIEGEKEAPLAGPCPPVREMRLLPPTVHGTPSLSMWPVRLATKTSLRPFVSPLTRFDASDWNAIARA